MGLKIERRTAQWGVINIREQGKGQDGKVEAHDIPFTIHGDGSLLDQIVEYDKDDDSLSAHLFDSDDGRVLIPGASILCHHKKEGLTITVWDKGPKKNPLVLKEVRIQEPKISLEAPNQVTVSSKIQITEPTDEVVNRFRHLRGEHCDIEIIAEQASIFDDNAAKAASGEGTEASPVH